MYIRKKINRSGTTNVVVVNKVKGKYKEIYTIGTSSINQEIDDFIVIGKQWIRNEELMHHPEFDFEGIGSKAKDDEYKKVTQFISQIDNILINETQLILDRVGFNRVEDAVFRHLVLSRLSFPVSNGLSNKFRIIS